MMNNQKINIVLIVELFLLVTSLVMILNRYMFQLIMEYSCVIIVRVFIRLTMGLKLVLSRELWITIIWTILINQVYMLVHWPQPNHKN